MNKPIQTTLTIGERITVWLISFLTRLDLTEELNMVSFVCSETVQSNMVKLETSRTVIIPPLVSVLWPVNPHQLYKIEHSTLLYNRLGIRKIQIQQITVR